MENEAGPLLASDPQSLALGHRFKVMSKVFPACPLEVVHSIWGARPSVSSKTHPPKRVKVKGSPLFPG